MANKIALVDASPADEAEFRTLLAEVGPHFRQGWEPGTALDADLVVVDLDSVFGHMTLQNLQRRGKRVAVFTTQETSEDSDLVLSKPLDAHRLSALLIAAGGEAPQASEPAAKTMSSAETAAKATKPAVMPDAAPPPVPTAAVPAVTEPSVSSAPATEPALPTAAPEPAPPPVAPPRETTLADFLTVAIPAGPVRLTTDGAPDLLLDPATQCYHATGSGLRPLAAHCTRSVSATELAPVSGADLDKARIMAPAQPFSRLLWFCTLGASSGQLLPGLDPNARYKLNRWPQIEREFPKHFRIATVMMKQLATLAGIAEAANAPLADVIDFVNAYHVVGYVENDMPKPAENMPEAKGGMLSRLRNPFGR